MKTPPEDKPSPFAARTRPPFGNDSRPALVPSQPPSTSSTPSIAPPPAKTLAGTPENKIKSSPLIIGTAVASFFIGGAIWFLSQPKLEPISQQATAAKNPVDAVVTAQSSSTTVLQSRDYKADYQILAARAASIEIVPENRPAVASAMLQATSGDYEQALAVLGPIILQQVRISYVQGSGALQLVKLGDHPVPAAQSLGDALARAETATKVGVWVDAVAELDKAQALIPAAKEAIADNLLKIARSAVERKDIDSATYFYTTALRLNPSSPEAKSHLYSHKYSAGQTLIGTAEINFAYIPPGEYTRGSRAAESGRGPDEIEAKVRLTAGFFIGLYEVSQRQWDIVYGAGSVQRLLTNARAATETINPDLPMHSVSWDQAIDFCKRLSKLDGQIYRLPTEAEWEYACRAGSTTAFNTGEDGLSARDAVIDDGSTAVKYAPAPVISQRKPNAWGLRDMHGNVWEWCADWSAPYSVGPVIDPKGPKVETIGRVELAAKILRGGGWNTSASDARSANRWEYSPAVATGYIGFRVVREPDLISP
jgi:formylglycine-generating enzyme required for sulfatase activity